MCSFPYQPVELASLALGRPAGAGRPVGRRRLTRARRLGWREIFVERARRGRRAATIVERQDLDDAAAALRQRDPDQIAGADRLGRLGRLLVDVDLAARARVGGEAARLEEPRGPEPFVDPQRRLGLHRGQYDRPGAHDTTME